jgi:hypothetical protein
MRYEVTATCLSWIPPAKAERMFSLPSGVSVTHRPCLRTSYRREHAPVRATTSCQLAVLSRGQLDDRALPGAATEAESLLNA